MTTRGANYYFFHDATAFTSHICSAKNSVIDRLNRIKMAARNIFFRLSVEKPNFSAKNRFFSPYMFECDTRFYSSFKINFKTPSSSSPTTPIVIALKIRYLNPNWWRNNVCKTCQLLQGHLEVLPPWIIIWKRVLSRLMYGAIILKIFQIMRRFFWKGIIYTPKKRRKSTLIMSFHNFKSGNCMAT